MGSVDELWAEQGEVVMELHSLLGRLARGDVTGAAARSELARLRDQEDAVLARRRAAETRLLEEHASPVAGSGGSVGTGDADPSSASSSVVGDGAAAARFEAATRPRPELTRKDTLIAPELDVGGMGRRMLAASMDTSTPWEITDPSSVTVTTKVLGQGAFGTVYAGTFAGKAVAVKKLHLQSFDDTEHEEEFVREVQIMAKLRHPNLLLLMGACVAPGHMFMVTELMSKGSVDRLLRPAGDKKARAIAMSGGSRSVRTSVVGSGGAGASAAAAGGSSGAATYAVAPGEEPEQFKHLSFKRRMIFAQEVAEAMNALHCMSPPVIHRDLKTANLLVDDNFVVKVCDFGLASARRVKGEAVGGEDSTPVGSPLYMAPEVLLGKPHTTASDVYSFGIVLWELVTERVPWDHVPDLRLSDIVTRVATKHERLPLEDTICARLRRLISACWHADPEQRPSFQSMLEAGEFELAVIEQLLSEEHPAARSFWHENFPGTFDVPWHQFRVAFAKAARLPIPPANTGGQLHQGAAVSQQVSEAYETSEQILTCIRAVCGLDYGRGLGSSVSAAAADAESGPQFVQLAHFAALVEWFGPWESDSGTWDAANMAQRVVSLLRSKYFHGSMTAHAAQDLIMTGGGQAAEKVKAKAGSYLLRFSASSPSPGTFALTFLKRDGKADSLVHWRLARQGKIWLSQRHGAPFNSLNEALDAALQHLCKRKKKSSLTAKHVNARTPFTHIFEASSHHYLRNEVDPKDGYLYTGTCEG